MGQFISVEIRGVSWKSPGRPLMLHISPPEIIKDDFTRNIEVQREHDMDTLTGLKSWSRTCAVLLPAPAAGLTGRVHRQDGGFRAVPR